MSWLYNGHIFEDKDIPEGAVGFIYHMSTIIDDKSCQYIGKKNFYSVRKKPLAKKALPKDKRKKKYDVVSKPQYQNYYSSNEVLKKAHEDGLPIKRVILQICFTNTELTYYETKAQFELGVLEDQRFLNGNILGKFYKFKPTKPTK